MGLPLAATRVWKKVLHCCIDFAVLKEIIQEEKNNLSSLCRLFLFHFYLKADPGIFGFAYAYTYASD